MRKKKLLKSMALFLAVATVGSLSPDVPIAYAETESTAVAAEGQSDLPDGELSGKGQSSGVNVEREDGEAETTEAETTEAETTEAEATETDPEETEATKASQASEQGKDSESEEALTDEASAKENEKNGTDDAVKTESSKAASTEDDKKITVAEDTDSKDVSAENDSKSEMGKNETLSVKDSKEDNKNDNEDTTAKVSSLSQSLSLEEASALADVEVSTPSDAETSDPLEGFVITNPHWEEGYAVWDDNLSDEQKALVAGVDIDLRKNGEFIERFQSFGNGTRLRLIGNMHDHGPGIYTYYISWLLKDGSGTEKWSDLSKPYEYEPKKGQKKAPIPMNCRWTKEGHIEWDPVSRSEMPGYKGDIIYYYRLYEEGENYKLYGKYEDSKATFHTKYMKAGKTYRFQIFTSGDGDKYFSSDYSELSEPFTVVVNEDTAKGKITSLLDSNEENIVLAVDSMRITDEERKVMADVLLKESQMAADFIELEKKYKSFSGNEFVIQSEDGIVNKNQVSVAGGTLNGATQIDFVQAQKADISLDRYFRKVTMDISLDKEELKFPVMITMPVPNGMNAETVIIYHYHDSGSKEEIKPAVVTENGMKKVRFAVSEFSIFTFVDTSNGSSAGSYSYTSPVRSSSGRSSSAASYVSAAATDIPANATVITGTWMKDEKGWWLRKSNHSYPKNQWAKINNAVYRFDKQGYMAEGWLHLNNKWYYLKPESGALVTGWLLDKGKWYYLNSDGVMATGWKQVDGKWYYLGGDGAMYADTTTPDNHQVDKSGARIN